MLQLTSRGAAARSSAPDVAALRTEFRDKRCVRLRSFIEPRLMARLQAQVAGATFADRAHGRISTELCMQPHACVGALHFLVNDPAVFRLVEELSGCRGLRTFIGRVYRMLAERGHYDSWHSDLSNDHHVGMSINLGAEPYEGGVFEIRRIGSGTPLASLPNVGAGDAILFAIADDLEHRVTPMRGTAAKTAFAGWFTTAHQYRDVVHGVLHSRSSS
jgi:hypothetical protein